MTAAAPALAQPAERPVKKPLAEPMMTAPDAAGLVAELQYVEGSRLLILGVRGVAGGQQIAMARKLELAMPLLRDFFARDPGGQLSLAVGLYPELGQRLFTAALASDRWDAGAGRLRAADTSVAAFTTQLLADGKMFAEVAGAFQELGFDTAVGSVENVILCRTAADGTPVVLDAAPSAADPAAKAPCGASLTFILSR